MKQVKIATIDDKEVDFFINDKLIKSEYPEILHEHFFTLEELFESSFDADIILLDIYFDGGENALSGIEVLTKLKPSIYIVVVSSTTSHHEIADCLAAGASGFVSKAYKQKEHLLKSITRLKQIIDFKNQWTI
jgi:DNA-binding NarL/FixJ family response regulator